MNQNTNIIGIIVTVILLLVVVLFTEKKYIKTDFKIEKYPASKIGYMVAESEDFQVNSDCVQGVLENSNMLNDFCNPQSLTFCAKPKPYQYKINPVLFDCSKRMWNPAKKNSFQGPMGAGLQPIPQIAMPSD